jgi:arylsulfatase A-like enzyme
MLSRKYLFPLTLGIAVGTAQGFLDAFMHHIEPAGYLRHGLYNTTAKLLVAAINTRVLMVCGLCYITWLAVLAGCRIGGRIRWISHLIAVVGLLLVVHFPIYSLCRSAVLGLRKIPVGVNASVWRDIAANGMPQIAACALVLIAGVFLLVWLRKNGKDTRGGPRSGSRMRNRIAEWWSSRGRNLQSVYRRHWEFDTIVLAVFICLNLLPLAFRATNSLRLRSCPNVIVIQIDTLRADHLGCYGYTRRTSPNIDAFSRQGIRFGKAISAAPWTSASLATYMTSRNLRIKLDPANLDGPPINCVQLAEALADRGYATVGVNSNLLASAKAGFARGYDHYDERYADVTSPLVLSDAVKRLQEIKNGKFFMFLLFMDPHSPYVLHDKYNFYPEYKGKLGKRVDTTPYEKGMSPDDLKYTLSLYDSSIAYTDEHIGMLFDELKKMNLYNDTLIVLLSDHGEEFSEHGLMGHGKHLYDESISVPLIIKVPGQKRGSTVGGVFPLLDLFPSIMDVLGLDTSAMELQGVRRHLPNLANAGNADIYSSTDFGSAKGECIRNDSYKLILESSKRELYNLRSDSGEKRNVSKSEPGVAAALDKVLKDRDREIDERLLGAIHQEEDGVNEKETRTLRSLGYLQ